MAGISAKRDFVPRDSAMTDVTSLPLTEWADHQAVISAEHMMQRVSATSIVKNRAGFSHIIRPAPGSVLAAIGSADDESEPDYFFHWLRDSAAVMDAALVLIDAGMDADGWKRRFVEFARFSLGLSQISGARFLAEHPDRETGTLPQLRQFLRPDADIATVEGDAVLGEVRYNADGTLDFLRWSRPQHDGVAARALTCLRYLEKGAVLPEAEEAVAALLRQDLAYTLKYAGNPCVDIWEEESAQHYYTLLVQYAALKRGSAWTQARGDVALCAEMIEIARRLDDRLEDFWSAEKGFYLSRIMPEGQTTTKELDLAVILGVLHAGRRNGRHSVRDVRVAKTLEVLENLFAADYALNREAGAGLALGRYKDDVYFSGGAYFFCTFGAAEFYYKLAAATGDAAPIAKGDAIFAMARRSIPASGEISEQFDQTTGAQTSAKSLTWSYASFLTCWQARKAAIAATKG
jgi:glucoamylase